MSGRIIIEPCIFSGENDLPPETPIYKYLSIEAFLDLIVSRRLIFSRITSWPDAFEGFRFNFFRRLINDENFSNYDKNDFYGNCWSLQTDDRRLYDDIRDHQAAEEELKSNGSAAMWESYCKHGGVRIKTTVGKLDELFTAYISDCRLLRGKVFYESAERYESLTHQLIYTIFVKRIPFRHETEYRYILIKNVAGQERIIAIKVNNLSELIDEILVAPASTNKKWIARTIYKISVSILPNGGNVKNGKQFCRISNLYGNISEEISDVDDTNW